MLNLMGLDFLKQMQSIAVSDGDISINGFSYPVFQQNGQKGIGPVRVISSFEFLKPKGYENEIFIDKVPCLWSENLLMEYLMQAGVVYFMRFMVNFSGQSRGIAYVQYVGQIPTTVMVQRLNIVFRQYNLKLMAYVSNNFRRLKIGNISSTLEEDRILLLFRKCYCTDFRLFAFRDNKKTYILTFENNRQACLARRFLLSHSSIIGPSIFVVWFDKPKKKF